MNTHRDAGWQVYESVRLSPSVLAARGRQILDKLADRRIRIPAGNRIEQAIRLTDEANASSDALREQPEAELYRFREAFRTLLESFIIVHTIYDRPRQTAWYNDEMLSRLLRGASTEKDDKNPHARNTQFELLVAASLILGGADIRHEEPDFSMLFHGKRVGIAVKRVRSLKTETLRRELVDAARQIRDSTRTGFVAANLDSRINELDTSSDLDRLGKSFHEQVSVAHDTMHEISEREAVIGYMFYGSWFGWALDGEMPRLEFHVPAQIRCFTTNAAQTARCFEFFGPLHQRHSRGLATIMQLISRPAA